MERKIVINATHGGFSLSPQAVLLYGERKGIKLTAEVKTWYDEFYDEQGNYFDSRSIARDDPLLVGIVEELGTNADGKHAQLKVVSIPYDVEWVIEDYDGLEWVAEKHRIWK